MATTRALAANPLRVSGRRAAVRNPRSYSRPALGILSGPQAAPSRRRGSRSSPPLRVTPTETRARGRDGPRRRPARRHSAPARARQPRHHEHLPPRNRQRLDLDHRHRPRTTIADDLRKRRPPNQPVATSHVGSADPSADPSVRRPPCFETLGWRIWGLCRPCARHLVCVRGGIDQGDRSGCAPRRQTC
jgi:hypothetical protein